MSNMTNITGSMTPIWILDFFGNVVVMVTAFYILFQVRKIIRLRPNTPLWVYLQWQAIALAAFALSHSVGHIIKRVLVFENQRGIWESISPVTGSINTLTFMVVGVLAFLYKDIESASEKFGALRDAKAEIEFTAAKLRESYEKMEQYALDIALRNKELSVFNSIAVSVSRSLGLDKVMEVVIRELRQFMDTAFMSIYLIKDGHIKLTASEGMSETLKDMVSRCSMDEPWIKREVMAGRTFVAAERPDDRASEMDTALSAGGVHSWSAVPLIAKGKVMGVLIVGSSQQEGIPARQMETLVTIGGYIGVVIENSMLYEDSKQKLDDLERFRKFSVGREMRIIELKEKLKAIERDIIKH